MKVNYFYSRNLAERLDFVYKHGVFITWIKYYGFYINLYILDSSFIEVYYNIQAHKIEEVELLDVKDDRLNLFAVNVNLSDLFKT